MEAKMEVKEYLSKFSKPLPEWLRSYKQGDKVSFAELMHDRVGYYPGNGYDGSLISVCNRAHCIHSFLYVDYGLSYDKLCAHLAQKDSFKGYHSIGHIEWREVDLMPNGYYPTDTITDADYATRAFMQDETSYCFTKIFERDAEYGDDWGAERFAVTFLFADGIATYYQLFVRGYKKAPWIFLLQDHGFGGNYNRFGKGGILDSIIASSGCRPKFVICDCHNNVWNGYSAIEGLNPVVRRINFHKALRYLFSDNTIKGDSENNL